LVLELHEGGEVKELKIKFKNALADVEATEIAKMEQELINEGELTAEQITKLCDLHVGIFEDSLKTKDELKSTPGHPVHTYVEENNEALRIIEEYRKNPSPELISKLSEIEKHYTRLENQLFPKLETKEFMGPSQVMWAKHDEIRDLFKKRDEVDVKEILKGVEDMVFKEEKILFPTALDLLDSNDWMDVKRGEEEIGFSWVTPGNEWQPITPEMIHFVDKQIDSSKIDLSTGKLTAKQIDLLLKTLPFDVTFVDENEKVVYYSDSTHRIFPRSPGIVGRKVENCHPPKSVHIVKKILDNFKNGTRDVAEFWLTSQDGDLIHIRYFALRDNEGKYQGTIEVSQVLTKLQKLKGKKTILDWK
ncbi:MAG: DUF438 domain-containing protein, partial [Candidatus Ranarchaeia archaeon]